MKLRAFLKRITATILALFAAPTAPAASSSAVSDTATAKVRGCVLLNNGVVMGRWTGMSLIEREQLRSQILNNGFTQDYFAITHDPVVIAAEKRAEDLRWVEFRKLQLRTRLAVPSTPLPLP